ncbi:NAD(P)-dependent alcohol dehydrogenase [Rhodococcus sp. (in: high G+C Gram-positive bacteria)]|uniref:zinc-dependent alcohol dehydrogenase family protein n=1 Tax=Rhodococcus sp. TaxID=1831 RepID=UPI002580A501|nr:NAD(P)-dependent alcohol dehydrogenase [Rhodococcus sp. (in: high G+C Gram-positive bacteria)]MBQ9056450.1 NAD(P)-dependent alcohol dehydrogenase [Rhodococcus sp. (in: high G+C Gram-positive bacteria)]
MTITALQVAAGGGFHTVNRIDLAEREPGPGEITVRIRASSLNYHDLGVVSGSMGPGEPRIPLSDGAGDVIAVGAQVTEFAVGDRVVSTFFPDWFDGDPRSEGFERTPGDGIDGFARTEVTMPVTAFTHAPAGYSHAEAATLTTAGVTAWRALFAQGGLRPGQTVLVQGTGGVSIFALQFAKQAGATVIATSSNDDKLAQLADLGADHLINYRTTPKWGAEARKLTGGRGVDHIIEVGGAETLAQSLRAVRVAGHIAVIGILSGVGGTIPLGLALARQVRLQSLLVGNRQHQIDMIRAINVTGLRPIIDRHLPLSDLVKAFEYQLSGNHFGKICLDI